MSDSKYRGIVSRVEYVCMCVWEIGNVCVCELVNERGGEWAVAYVTLVKKRTSPTVWIKYQPVKNRWPLHPRRKLPSQRMLGQRWVRSRTRPRVSLLHCLGCAECDAVDPLTAREAHCGTHGQRPASPRCRLGQSRQSGSLRAWQHVQLIKWFLVLN